MKKIVKKKWWFTLLEIMIAVFIMWLMASLWFSYLRAADEKEAANTFKLLFSTSLENISQEAKNWVTTQNLDKFANSSNPNLKTEYANNATRSRWEYESFSRFSPLNQTAFYYWLYLNVWKTFMRQVQYEQEWCSERRTALLDKLYWWANFWNLDTSASELSLDLSSLILDEDNYSSANWSSRNTWAKTLEIKEAELLDSWSCYISSQKKIFWTNRLIWLKWIDFWDWRWMVKDNSEWVVVLVDANSPYQYRLFNKNTKINSIRNQFNYDLTWLQQDQRKFLLKNYWVDNINWSWELKRVKLQFSMTPSNPNNCEEKDFVDFSTRANAWATYNTNLEKWLICLTLDSEALSEMSRSR